MTVFSCLLISGWAARAEQEHRDRAELEQEYVRTLAAGGNASELAEALRSLPPPRRASRSSLSEVAAELKDAMRAFRDALPGEGRALSPKKLPDLLAAHDGLRAADLLVREHFEGVEKQLRAAGVSAEILERLDDARGAYNATLAEILEPLAAPLATVRAEEKSLSGAELESLKTPLAAARVALEKRLAAPRRPILGAGSPPFRRPRLAARPPTTEPPVRPSYLDPLAGPPAAADLRSTPEAPLDDEILALAASLDHDYVKIYEFVKNEIETEWYAGSMKGALATLRDRAGNDVDQASLLIALARASQLAARYVHGVIELPVEHLIDELGLPNPARVPTALARAGIAHTPVVRGGRVAAVHVEATWVVAYVPYSNYRGAVVDFSGRTWLPLAPAFKTTDRVVSTAILRQMGYDVAGLVDRFLIQPPPTDVVATLRDDVETYLFQNAPGATYEEQLGSRALVEQRLGLLPNSLPFPVVAVTAEAAELADEHRVRVRFVVRAGEDETSSAVLDATVSLADLVARRVTLSYVPATVDDHRATNAFGGLSGVPLYLVRVRPRIKVDGRPAPSGGVGGASTGLVGEALGAGRLHQLEIEVSGPFGSARVERDVVSGSYHALGLGVQALPPRMPAEGDLRDTELRTASLLAGIALSFDERWGAAEAELAGLLDVALLRPLPSISVVTSDVEVEELTGLPFQLRFKGVTLDALLRAAEPLARGADAASVTDFTRLWALAGSVLEHRVFEDDFLVESVSADKGLAVARRAGVEVLRLDQGDTDPRLAGLGAHPAYVLDDVRGWLRNGFVVEIPVDRITLVAWTGSVWRVENPASGEAGYFISGGLAGAATAVPVGNWILTLLAETLAAPYTGDPNEDPLAAATIRKVFTTDNQTEEVDQFVSEPLAVLVHDAFGRPVKGAEVEFRILRGGGSLDLFEPDIDVVTVETDRKGWAEAPLRLGRVTADNPVYLLRDEDDEHLSQALLHQVEASVASSQGTLLIEFPFTAIGFPGPQVELVRTDTDNIGFEQSGGMWADTLVVQARDEHGNSVSNVPITFTQSGVTGGWDCDPPQEYPEDSRFFEAFLDTEGNLIGCPDERFPLMRDSRLNRDGCGEPYLEPSTRFSGVAVGLILGTHYGATHHIKVEAKGVDNEDLEPLFFAYLEEGDFLVGASNGCTGHVEYLAVARGFVSSPTGVNITAARPGEEYGSAIEVLALEAPFVFFPDIRWRPTFTSRAPGVDPATPPHWTETILTPSQVRIDNGGSALPVQIFIHGFDDGEPECPIPGFYATQLTAGPQPGIHDVELERPFFLLSPGYFIATGLCTFIETFLPQLLDDGGDRVGQMWSVQPEIVEIVPDVPTLLTSGRLEKPLEVKYKLDPPEYEASRVEVDLLEDEQLLETAIGSSLSGEGTALFERGLIMDREKKYVLQVVVNRGSLAELVSDELPLELAQTIIRRADSSDPYRSPLGDASRGVFVSQEVDVLNERVCTTGTNYIFELTQPARVTLSYRSVQALKPDGSPELGPEKKLIDDEELAAGEHQRLLTPADLPPGDYELELEAISTIDEEQTETIKGGAHSEYRVRNSLAVGHALVKGVDVYDGHLAVSRLDLSVAGRGVPLQLARTYSSNSEEPGRLGVGWSHNWESKLVVTPCGEVVLIGGEGSGMRFVDDGRGGLRPLKGFHGTLVADTVKSTFDFFSKNGTRWHYQHSHDREWHLKLVEDPNGNRTDLIYEGEPDNRHLVTVRKPSGVALDFEYERRAFALWEDDVVTRIRASGGTSVSFTYDVHGNLIRAVREALKSESYAYDNVGFQDRHLLTAVTDGLTGAVTRYEYSRAAIGVETNVQVPQAMVTRLTTPDTGVTRIQYDVSGLGSRAPPVLVTRVTDARGFTTVYTLNQYGSPLRIEDPEGNVTTMTWPVDDVLMLSRTDGNGVTTELTYDADGNLLTETTGGFTTARTYHPPGAFLRPIKDRLATLTNRNGTVTSFTYDVRGNLLETETAGWVTEHTYAANGDRRSTIDRNGNATLFSYDTFGQLIEASDALGVSTTMAWNIRGEKVAEADPLDRETRFSYDALGRLTRVELPNGGVSTTAYLDAARMRVETDALNRATEIEIDAVGRIVAVRLSNGATKLFEYDLEGNRILESNWHGVHSVRADVIYEHDGAGRLWRRTEPLGRITEYAYDGVGNVLSETLKGPDILDRITRFTYDALGRQTSRRRQVDAATEVVTLLEYDGEGNLLKRTDPLGRELTTTYDAFHRPLTSVGPEGLDLAWAYDANGNLLSTTVASAAGDQVRQAVYDEANRQVEEIDAEGASTLFEYDLAGQLVRQIDPRLNLVELAYNEMGQVVRQEVAGKWVTTYDYDLLGNRVSEVPPNGNSITYAYDEFDRLIRVNDSVGRVLERALDEQGNVLTTTDANGNVTTTVYDQLDRPVSQTLPESRVVQVSYDTVGNRVSQTDALDNVTTFEYDLVNRLTRLTDALDQSASFTYDLAGNRVTETDFRNFTTAITYDGLNRPIEIKDPLDQAVTRTFDPVGNLTSEVDGRGVLNELTYDKQNRRLTTARTGIVIETVEYDAAGNPIFVTDANNNITGLEYDERNLLVAVNRPLAAITRYTLDAIGNRIEERDPEGRVFRRTLDSRNRVLTQSNGAGETAGFTYDGNGNVLTVERPEGGVVTREYDGADRLVRIEDPLSHATSFTYDKNDNLLSFSDAASSTTSFAYDALDRQISKSYTDGSVETYEYDTNGNLTLLVDANGQAVTSTYDALDRLVQLDYSQPVRPVTDTLASILLTYDPNNNLTSATEVYDSSNRVTAREFDPFDRLTRITDGFGKTLEYGYDTNGNRTFLVDPDGLVTRYTYDALNRPLNVTLPQVGTASYAYFRNSLLKSVAYPNGSEASYTYDLANRVSQLVNSQGGGTPISSFAYTYDANGNRIEQIETQGGVAETTSYVYDRADRLTQATYPDVTTTYTLDAVGNRLGEIGEDGTGTTVLSRAYAYDNRHRLLQVTDLLDPAKDLSYGYDANGNLISRSRNGSVLDLTYDVLDQLVEVRQDNMMLAQLGYDYQGLRVSKQGLDGLIRYVYDDQSVLLQTNVAGDTIAKYEYGADRLISMNHYTEGRSFYLFDGLGSVSNLVSATGAQTARYQYDAWGNLRQQSGSSWNPFGFTGYEHDRETGFYYAKARFYDPEVGRFLTEDPFQGDFTDPPTLQRYLYARGNPTTFVDPDGELAFLAAMAIGAGIGIAVDLVVQYIESDAEGVIDFLANDVDTRRLVLSGLAGGISGGVGNAALQAGARGVVAFGLAVATDTLIDTAFERSLSENPEDFDTGQSLERNFLRNVAAGGAFAAVSKFVRRIKASPTSSRAGPASRRSTRPQQVANRAGRSPAKQSPKSPQPGEVPRRPAKQGDLPSASKPKEIQTVEVPEGTIGPCRRCNRVNSANVEECFVAGTPVLTLTGLLPIEEIRSGDQVWSRDDETGEMAFREVVRTFQNLDKEILEIEIESAAGISETLGVTTEHPFWVIGDGWVAAQDLEPGDQLFTARGETVWVRRKTRAPDRQTVYNFEVAEYHTYFVGESQAWAHNMCHPTSGQKQGEQLSLFDNLPERQPRQLKLPFESSPSPSAGAPNPRQTSFDFEAPQRARGGAADSALKERFPLGRELPGERPIGTPTVPGRHNALSVITGKDGQIRLVKQTISGESNPSSFERLISGRRYRAADTEARLAVRVRLLEGEVMTILGQQQPCTSCRGFMKRAAGAYRAKYSYQWWDGDGNLRVWETWWDGKRVRVRSF